jgi:hypothetical protein
MTEYAFDVLNSVTKLSFSIDDSWHDRKSRFRIVSFVVFSDASAFRPQTNF